jgi:predicted dinucleotide-binding enzyme
VRIGIVGTGMIGGTLAHRLVADVVATELAAESTP